MLHQNPGVLWLEGVERSMHVGAQLGLHLLDECRVHVSSSRRAVFSEEPAVVRAMLPLTLAQYQRHYGPEPVNVADLPEVIVGWRDMLVPV